MAAATSSLPVPDSPMMSTRESLGATRAISSRTRANAGLSPIISPLRPYSRRSDFASRRSCRSSSAELRARRTPSGLRGFSRKLNAPSFVARTANIVPRERTCTFTPISNMSAAGAIATSVGPACGNWDRAAKYVRLTFEAALQPRRAVLRRAPRIPRRRGARRPSAECSARRRRSER